MMISWFQADKLVKALEDLENSASSDARVREQIAALPPEVSDVSMLDKLQCMYLKWGCRAIIMCARLISAVFLLPT